MRAILAFVLLAGAAGPAFAADPAPAAEPPICTTVTTVVKRGDVVLSTSSTTKCEDAAHPGGGLRPGALLEAPAAVLAAPAKVFDAVAAGNGDRLTLRNTPGDWRAVDGRTGDVCHLVLSVRAASAGFVARPEGCRGSLGRVRSWTFRDGGAELHGAGGALVARLTGDREHLAGAAADGDRLTLER